MCMPANLAPKPMCHARMSHTRVSPPLSSGTGGARHCCTPAPAAGSTGGTTRECVFHRTESGSNDVAMGSSFAEAGRCCCAGSTAWPGGEAAVSKILASAPPESQASCNETPDERSAGALVGRDRPAVEPSLQGKTHRGVGVSTIRAQSGCRLEWPRAASAPPRQGRWPHHEPPRAHFPPRPAADSH